MLKGFVSFIVALSFSVTAYGCTSYDSNIPFELISKSMDEVRSMNLGTIEEGDFVDEDETDVHTMEWFLTLSNGHELSLFADDGVITSLRVMDNYFVTDKNIKVGDTLAEVKEAYPDTIFSCDVPALKNTGILFLHSKSQKLDFIFSGKRISSKIRKGGRCSIEDPEIRALKLYIISVESVPLPWKLSN